MNKNKFKKKIIIGTANFTQNYGSDLIKINKDEVKKILNKAEKNGIKKSIQHQIILKIQMFFNY